MQKCNSDSSPRVRQCIRCYRMPQRRPWGSLRFGDLSFPAGFSQALVALLLRDRASTFCYILIYLIQYNSISSVDMFVNSKFEKSEGKRKFPHLILKSERILCHLLCLFVFCIGFLASGVELIHYYLVVVVLVIVLGFFFCAFCLGTSRLFSLFA